MEVVGPYGPATITVRPVPVRLSWKSIQGKGDVLGSASPLSLMVNGVFKPRSATF